MHINICINYATEKKWKWRGLCINFEVFMIRLAVAGGEDGRMGLDDVRKAHYWRLSDKY